MKLKDIPGLIPEYKTYLINKLGYPDNILKAHNDCLDLLAEREIEVSVCKKCGGWDLKIWHIDKNCDCTNGVIITVKEN